MPFEFKRMEISDVILVKPKVFEDKRGYFMEIYKKPDFEEVGIDVEFVQENHSRSKRGVLRGLHFQKAPYAQSKLVRCIRGRIFDVGVDIRKESPTFLEYVSTELTEDNREMLFIPRGFAHGFLTLSEVAEVIYKVDEVYAPRYEGGIIWNDDRIGIRWPIDNPKLSTKDRDLPTYGEIRT